MRAYVILTLIIVIGGLTLIAKKPPQDNPAASPPPRALPVYQRVCQQCHGPTGEGKVDLRTPSIAGQPEWYLIGQLQKFRLGQRGAEPRDTHGQQMRATALALSESELAEAARAASAFPSRPTQPTIAGDLDHGRQLYDEQCIECHRYNGSGEKVFGSSPLTTFQDWYLATQIENFRTGIRGYHADDEKGQQMRHLLSYLEEGDASDLAAYIASLAVRYPPQNRGLKPGAGGGE